jgi:hypothetical protein
MKILPPFFSLFLSFLPSAGFASNSSALALGALKGATEGSTELDLFVTGVSVALLVCTCIAAYLLRDKL